MAAVVLLAPAWASAVALTTWAQALAEGGAAVALFFAARHTRGMARRVWGLLALASGIWAITDGIHALLIVTGVEVPEVSALDVGWLGYYVPAGIAAFVLYQRLRPERGWQGALDGLIVTFALTGIGWVTLIQGRAAEGAGGTLGSVVGSAYPFLDLACATALAWVVVRQGSRTPAWLGFIALAFALQAVAGMSYLGAVLGVTDADLIAAIAYVFAATCWISAGLARRAAPERAWEVGAHDRPPAWSRTAVFGLAVGLVALGATMPSPELRFGAVLVAGLMAIRAIDALHVAQNLLAERDHMLATDPLTGAHNRRFLDEELTRAVARATRTGAPLAAIALDIDRFKAVNDHLGHGAGDDLLRAVAAELTEGMRTGDLLFRLGGDEFLVLCPETDAASALTLAERLRVMVLGAGVVVPEVPVSASFGIAALPEHADDATTLLSRADAALYTAKGSGRDAVAVWAPASRPALA